MSWIKNHYWKTRARAIEGLSRLGAATGQEWLTYNRWVYESFWENARDAAPGFARALCGCFPDVRTVVDYGCGTGNYVAELRSLGIHAEGFEYSPRARRVAASRLGIKLHPFDLAHFSVASRVDLAMSLEVAEHLSPAMGDTLVSALAQSAPLVVFSAAAPNQGGIGHVNEQPREYWIERFRDRRFTEDVLMSARLRSDLGRMVRGAPWLASNVCVFHEAVPSRLDPRQGSM